MVTRRNKDLLEGFICACKTSVTTLRIHAVKPNNKSFLKRLGEAQVVFLQ